MDLEIPDAALGTLFDRAEEFTLGGAWVATISGGKQRSRWKVRAPSIDQTVYALDFLDRATRELHFEGSWVVGWTEFSLQTAAYSRFFVMFLDRDGDTCFQIDFDQDPWFVMVAAVDDYLEQCADAHRMWRAHLTDVEVAPSQVYRPHQGEESLDLTQRPIDPISGLN